MSKSDDKVNIVSDSVDINKNEEIHSESITESPGIDLNTATSASLNSLPAIIVPTTTNNSTSNQDITRTADEMNNNTSRTNRLLPSLRFTRDLIERRGSSGRTNWRENFNNVFRDLTPLVQNSNNSSNNQGLLGSWIPNGRNFRLSSNNNDLHVQASSSSANVSMNTANDSIVINLEESPSTSSFPRETSNANLTATSNGSYINSTYGLDRSQNNQPTHFVNQSQSSLNESNLNVSTASVHNHSNLNDLNNESVENGNNPENESVSEALSQIPEARALINTLSRYTPYICILLAKSCYDHLDGILDIFALFITFAHANFVVRQEISKQSQRRFLPLIRELIYIVLVIAIIGFMLEKKNTFISLMFTPYTSSDSEPLSLKNLLFSACLTDLILKLFTVGFKILFTMLPACAVEYKNRGRIYLMMESISQLYRALSPIQLWLVYLIDSYQGTEKIMGVILSAAYMVAKGADLVQRAKFCKISAVKLLQKTSFGTTPSKDQIQNAGGLCPICHENYNSPVLLECNHIFCELCIGHWFDKETTCPLCRAKIADDPSFRDGATTNFIQFY